MMDKVMNENNPARLARVTQAVLEMKKPDLATLQCTMASKQSR
jgi:hypothetical protein